MSLALPLDLLIKMKDRTYEMTSAAVRRAIQINLAGDEELAANKNKIVSLALRQILTQKVQYSLEE
jgi:DNA-directed RNA polymerase subunit omega